MDGIQLLVTITVAFGSAYLGSKWALRNYYSQRWWDRKADAYAKFTQHNRNLTGLCQKIYPILFTKVDEAREDIKQLRKISEDMNLDLLENSVYLTREAAAIVQGIHIDTLMLAFDAMEALENRNEVSRQQVRHNKLEARQRLLDTLSALDENHKQFTGLMRRDLNIRNQSQTDLLIDWASDLIKRFKQRYRLGSNSD